MSQREPRAIPSTNNGGLDNMSRRRFTISVAAGTLATGYAVSKTSPIIDKGSEKLWYTVKDFLGYFGRPASDVKDVFFKNSIAKVHVGADHPHHPGVPHPSNKAASGPFVQAISNLCPTCEPREDPVRTDFAGSWVVCGSPTSSDFARRVLGYVPAGSEDSSGFIRPSRGNKKVAFEYVLDANRLRDADASNSLLSKNKTVRNHGIFDRESKRILKPRYVNGVLSEEFLLISCVQNNIDNRSRINGDTVCVVEGTHGLGSAGALNFINDRLDASKNPCVTRALMIHCVRNGDGVYHGAGPGAV
jgi:hypothetical protein